MWMIINVFEVFIFKKKKNNIIVKIPCLIFNNRKQIICSQVNYVWKFYIAIYATVNSVIHLLK